MKRQQLTIESGDQPIEIIYMASDKLNEPVAWYGPIVMNTREELIEAYTELDSGDFIKQQATYENKV